MTLKKFPVAYFKLLVFILFRSKVMTFLHLVEKIAFKDFRQKREENFYFIGIYLRSRNDFDLIFFSFDQSKVCWSHMWISRSILMSFIFIFYFKLKLSTFSKKQKSTFLVTWHEKPFFWQFVLIFLKAYFIRKKTSYYFLHYLS